MINYAANVNNVLGRIKSAAGLKNTGQNEVTLVAVTKTQSVEAIRALYQCGLRNFGENRVEEFQMKVDALADLQDIKWHFIGSLQSKQAGPVAQSAHVFHAVDRIKIARILSDQLKDRETPLDVYIQVNVSGEESKHGFDCSVWEQSENQRADLMDSINQIAAFKNLAIKGLMTMAPMTASQDEVAQVFSRTRSLFGWANQNLQGTKMTDISMGMSGDFETAIQQGATVVRVGSAIFK